MTWGLFNNALLHNACSEAAGLQPVGWRVTPPVAKISLQRISESLKSEKPAGHNQAPRYRGCQTSSLAYPSLKLSKNLFIRKHVQL